mmetsp:Transcript_122722/g.393005  ORF Transcript_122722/g.393005 Transcript_122722/m.393005 type:complete len:211 (+) Transcript_122722:2050-2682(+)
MASPMLVPIATPAAAALATAAFAASAIASSAAAFAANSFASTCAAAFFFASAFCAATFTASSAAAFSAAASSTATLLISPSAAPNANALACSFGYIMRSSSLNGAATEPTISEPSRSSTSSARASNKAWSTIDTVAFLKMASPEPASEMTSEPVRLPGGAGAKAACKRLYMMGSTLTIGVSAAETEDTWSSSRAREMCNAGGKDFSIAAS